MPHERIKLLLKDELEDKAFSEDFKTLMSLDIIKSHSIYNSLQKFPKILEELDNNGNDLDMNSTMEVIINSLDEAFLIFNSEGVCHPSYSKKCEELFNTIPSGENIGDVLKIKDDDKSSFNQWIGHLFSGALDFSEIAILGPSEVRFKGCEGKFDTIISVDYRPMRSGDGTLEWVIVVGKDVTNEVKAELATANLKEYSDMIVKSIYDWDSFESFFECYYQFLDKLKMWKEGTNTIDEVLIILHTIKGTASSLSMGDFRIFVHQKEDEILDIISKHGKKVKFKEYVEKLTESLIFKFSKFLRDNHLVFKNYFDKKNKTKKIKEIEIFRLADLLQKNKCSDEILDLYFKHFVEVTVSTLFSSYQGKINTVSEEFEKIVNIVIEGDMEVTIAYEPYQMFFSNLFHLFNNCVYHGIEHPIVREKMGKVAMGEIKLVIGQVENQWLTLNISDDGAGIDIDKIKCRMIDNGVDINKLENAEIINGIFMAGVSTEDTANETAGRGIGMPALKDIIDKMNGTIEVSSIKEKGSNFHIKLPLYQGIEYYSKQHAPTI